MQNRFLWISLKFDRIRMSYFTFSKYTVLVSWWEETFQKTAYIYCKQYNTGIFKIIAKHLTRYNVQIGTNFMVLFIFGLCFWVERKVEEGGFKGNPSTLIQGKTPVYISNARDAQKQFFQPTKGRLFFAVAVLVCAFILRDVKRSSAVTIHNNLLNRWRK